jgi:hypothetical protein
MEFLGFIHKMICFIDLADMEDYLLGCTGKKNTLAFFIFLYSNIFGSGWITWNINIFGV